MKTRELSILGYNREIDRLEAEIERQGRYIKSLEYYEATNKADIERLRAVLDAEARNRVRILDEQEAEIERLEALLDMKQDAIDAAMQILAALEADQ